MPGFETTVKMALLLKEVISGWNRDLTLLDCTDGHGRVIFLRLLERALRARVGSGPVPGGHVERKGEEEEGNRGKPLKGVWILRAI